MMYELRVIVDFAAAHHIEGYPGDCARPHGHNWEIEVFARSKGLDEIGLAMDFRVLKVALKELIAPWDHQDLNTLEDFKGINPSAEQMAKLVFEKLNFSLFNQKSDSKNTSMWLDRVTVWENKRCSATYFGEKNSV